MLSLSLRQLPINRMHFLVGLLALFPHSLKILEHVFVLLLVGGGLLDGGVELLGERFGVGAFALQLLSQCNLTQTLRRTYLLLPFILTLQLPNPLPRRIHVPHRPPIILLQLLLLPLLL